jgi:hypothetical protein
MAKRSLTLKGWAAFVAKATAAPPALLKAPEHPVGLFLAHTLIFHGLLDGLFPGLNLLLWNIKKPCGFDIDRWRAVGE